MKATLLQPLNRSASLSLPRGREISRQTRSPAKIAPAGWGVSLGRLAIPTRYQHRVLFWGVLGALVLRAAFIAAGATLLARFHWTLYVFGVILLFTAWRMWRSRHRSHDPEQVEMAMIPRLRSISP